MSIRIVTGGGNAYLDGLHRALGAAQLAVDKHTLKAWQDGSVRADAKRDIVVADSLDVAYIGAEFGAVAVATGCAADGARDERAIIQGAGWRRPRTFTVAADDWTAYRLRRHTGVVTDRVIYAPVDTDKYFPAERQRLKAAEEPVVAHGKDGFTPDALRETDLYLYRGKGDVGTAMATGLIVVGEDTGLLWGLDGGDPVSICCGATVAWFHLKASAVVFDERLDDDGVREVIDKAWHMRTHFQTPNAHALRWLSIDTFTAKWLQALRAASRRFETTEDMTRPLDGTEALREREVRPGMHSRGRTG